MCNTLFLYLSNLIEAIIFLKQLKKKREEMGDDIDSSNVHRHKSFPAIVGVGEYI